MRPPSSRRRRQQNRRGDAGGEGGSGSERWVARAAIAAAALCEVASLPPFGMIEPPPLRMCGLKACSRVCFSVLNLETFTAEIEKSTTKRASSSVIMSA